ncbi:hypothetical protein LEMLEM_LOCUS5276 [Lemmus lemmus]
MGQESKALTQMPAGVEPAREKQSVAASQCGLSASQITQLGSGKELPSSLSALGKTPQKTLHPHGKREDCGGIPAWLEYPPTRLRHARGGGGRAGDGGDARFPWKALEGEPKAPLLEGAPSPLGRASEERVEPVQYGCARPPDCRRRGFAAARRPRPPSPAQRLSRGRTGCEVSEAGACAVGRGARGGGFITTS